MTMQVHTYAFLSIEVFFIVKHFMALSASEPDLTWFNTSSYPVNTTFDFDGVCDVTISCVPSLDGITHTINGNQLVMTLTKTVTTVLNEYICTLKPFHGERTYSNITRDVFFGTEILGFWVSKVYSIIRDCQ